MKITPSIPSDLPLIIQVARQAVVFDQEEIATVDELFQAYLKDPEVSGYNFLSCFQQDELAGFACWGPTALTKGTIDLYWICTSPRFQAQGIGRALFKEIESITRKINRWLIVIWTSSKKEYQPARSFYEHMGCTLSSQIADFYDYGDDLCVFTRRLS